MKRILLLALLVFTTIVSVEGQTAIKEANAELREGARQYKAGHFIEAQQHFEKALALDPAQKKTQFFIARAIHAQYKPGDESPENIVKARAAIAAYQQAMTVDPNNEEAYKSVASLYGALSDVVRQRDWIMQRGLREDVSGAKRSDAFTYLASADASCSNAITELPINKPVVLKDNKTIVQYAKPQDERDFDKAKQCATSGLELIERAISLDPSNETAWSAKTALLLEMAKLAEMDGDAGGKTTYNGQADAAQQRTVELNKANQLAEQREEARTRDEMPLPNGNVTLVAPAPIPPIDANPSPKGVSVSGSVTIIDTPPPPPPPTSPPTTSVVVSGGVLNGKAISKPDPVYPQIDQSGIVVVQVLVDEGGRVISANAVSGPPLLRQAAVQAAYQAQFSQTLLSGQPVKLSGTLTYNFTR